MLLGHVSYLWHVLIWPNSPLNPLKNFSKGLPRRIETFHQHIHCWPRVIDRLVLVYRPLWQLLKIIIVLLISKIIYVLKLWLFHEFFKKKKWSEQITSDLLVRKFIFTSFYGCWDEAIFQFSIFLRCVQKTDVLCWLFKKLMKKKLMMTHCYKMRNFVKSIIWVCRAA